MVTPNGIALPNGSLRWFGFDFDRIELPDDPILRGDDPPVWVRQDLMEFVFETGISDAKVVIYIDEFDIVTGDDDDATATPKVYHVDLSAHGFDRAESFMYLYWRDVQQYCKRAEYRLDESFPERHVGCEDKEGNPTDEACSFCERG